MAEGLPAEPWAAVAATGPGESSEPTLAEPTLAEPKQRTSRGAGERRPRRPGRGWGVAAIALGVVAVLGGVFAAGWASANTLVIAPSERPMQPARVITLPDTAMSGAARMPDVRGLSEADAQQAIVDAGIDASIISASERPAAGAPGRVIQQLPAFGAVNPSLVSITVSTAAEVPVSAGRSAAEVIGDLQRLGARVVQTRVYDPAATVGNAVRTEPAAGAQLPETVVLFIADTPSERSLQDFDTVGSTPSWSSDTLFAGRSVDQLARFSADRSTSLSDHSWKLNGVVTTLRGQYALEEDSDPQFSGVFIVLADGVEVARLEAQATPSDFALDVSGVQTLVIRAQRTLPDQSGSLVLLDPVALGSYELMAGAP